MPTVSETSVAAAMHPSVPVSFGTITPSFEKVMGYVDASAAPPGARIVWQLFATTGGVRALAAKSDPIPSGPNPYLVFNIPNNLDSNSDSNSPALQNEGFGHGLSGRAATTYEMVGISQDVSLPSIRGGLIGYDIEANTQPNEFAVQSHPLVFNTEVAFGSLALNHVHTQVQVDQGIGAVVDGTTDISNAALPALYGIGGTLVGTTLILDVDGTTATVTFTAVNAANQATMFTTIQAAWANLVASANASNNLVLTDDVNRGPASFITVGAGTANVILGLVPGTTFGTQVPNTGAQVKVYGSITGTGAFLRGGADITNPALYGVGGLLDGETLILNVDGGGALTLNLNGATNALSESALLAGIQAEWPTLFVGQGSGLDLLLASTSTPGTLVLGGGTANAHLGLVAGSVGSLTALIALGVLTDTSPTPVIPISAEGLGYVTAQLRLQGNNPNVGAGAVTAVILGADENIDLGGSGPPVPSPVLGYAMFFAQMPGDNAATIAVSPAAGSEVQFPQNGPTTGAVTRAAAHPNSEFVFAVAGTYLVNVQCSISEAAQLQLAIGAFPGAGIPATTSSRTTGDSQVVISAIITVAAGAILSVINPPGNATALTMTPADGNLTHAVGATLSIVRLA